MSLPINKQLSPKENLYELIRHTWPDQASVLTEDNVIITRGPIVEGTRDQVSVTIQGTGELVIGTKEVVYTATDLSRLRFDNAEVATEGEMATLITQFIGTQLGELGIEADVGEITWNGDTWSCPLTAKTDALVLVGALNMIAYHTLQPLVMNIYDDPQELADAIASLRPITQKEIFDTWPRFDVPMTGGGSEYWEDPSQATGDTKAWEYQESTGQVLQPLNTESWTGFISKNKYDRYDHMVTIGSTGVDDDFNGVVLAHTYQNGINNLLLLALSPNPGNAATWPGAENSSNVIVIREGVAFSPFAATNDFITLTNPKDPKSPGNWSVKGERRVYVSRRGDNFTIELSDWGSDVVSDKYTFEINLNDDPSMDIFKGPHSYGYFSLSQPNSYFKDIFFDGGERPDTILFAPDRAIYEYVPGEGWKVDPNQVPLAIYGAPRELRNAKDGKRYVLREDGSITPL